LAPIRNAFVPLREESERWHNDRADDERTKSQIAQYEQRLRISDTAKESLHRGSPFTRSGRLTFACSAKRSRPSVGSRTTGAERPASTNSGERSTVPTRL